MQGHKKLIAVLNELLADELSAINQYLVHAEMCDHWGYQKLQQAIEHQAHEEMQHAHWLIRRIIFLDGGPVVSKLNPMRIGKSVVELVANDAAAELEAVMAYNAAVRVARAEDDQATVDLLAKILTMEEEHLEWAEQQREQIKQMGVENYLCNQTEAAVA
jgi:bacterioferritin